MVMESTALPRGSGVMLVMSAIGATVSMVTASAEEATEPLPAASVAVAVKDFTPLVWAVAV